MDKLTTEQKAKRYDEVIEKLRSLHDDYDREGQTKRNELCLSN